MAYLYLLDTNLLSDVIKNPQGHAACRLAKEKPNSLGTSILVAAEMRYGIAKKNALELVRHVKQLLSTISVRPLAGDADRHLWNSLR